MQHRQKMTSLLQALRELYHRVYTMDLFRRINSYHGTPGRVGHYDISRSLTKHIEKLVLDSKPGDHPIPVVHTSPPVIEARVHTENPVKLQPTLVQKVIDGFSKYVKTSARNHETDHYMGDKLKASTWSHIHAAGLHARNGELNTAKLHADIANQALKEAAHYMSDEDYKTFCADVEKELNDVREIKS